MIKTSTSVILLILSCYMSFGQIRPSSDANTSTGGICSCSIANTANARDGNNSTFALFDASFIGTGLIAHVSREYDFISNLNQGDELSFLMAFDDATLLSILGAQTSNATIFDQLKIDLMDGSTVEASYGGGLSGNLATVDVVDPSTSSFRVYITVPKSNINRIRINSGAFVALGSSPAKLHVYDMVSSPSARYYANRNTDAGQNGLALLGCLLCSVDNENDAETHNADPNSNYASMKWNLGLSLFGNEYQYLEYDWGNTPDNNLLGDNDGVGDAIIFDMQVSGILDLGVNDLGLDLWSSGGIELMVTYDDGTTGSYDNSSSLLSASVLGSGSGRFKMEFEVPNTKTVSKVEVRRVAPTVGLFTELKLYSIYSEPRPSVLPVDFLSVHIEDQDEELLFTWSTGKEVNNDYFTIEGSTDGDLFEEISEINGVGNSSEIITYTYLSHDSENEEYTYFRIKQTDVDGKFSYSSVHQVERIADTEMSVHPNPTQGNLVITSDQNIGYIEIYDQLGNMILSYHFEDSQIEELDLHAMNPGRYLLKIFDNSNHITTEHIIKM